MAAAEALDPAIASRLADVQPLQEWVPKRDAPGASQAVMEAPIAAGSAAG